MGRWAHGDPPGVLHGDPACARLQRPCDAASCPHLLLDPGSRQQLPGSADKSHYRDAIGSTACPMSGQGSAGREARAGRLPSTSLARAVTLGEAIESAVTYRWRKLSLQPALPGERLQGGSQQPDPDHTCCKTQSGPCPGCLWPGVWVRTQPRVTSLSPGQWLGARTAGGMLRSLLLNEAGSDCQGVCTRFFLLEVFFFSSFCI